MAIYIFICDRNGVFVNFEKPPKFFEQCLIGMISDEDSNFAQPLIGDKKIALLNYINHFENVVFNQKQLEALAVEIEYAEKAGLVKANIVSLIKGALSFANKKTGLYLMSKID